MRIAYLDCFAGISGDMFLGALVDAGIPLQVMQDATASLNLGATLKVETVDRSGIKCSRVLVMAGERIAEEIEGAHVLLNHRTALNQETADQTGYFVHPKTQHLCKPEHSHEHDHHEYGRSLSVIRSLIQETMLKDEVKNTALRAFELLGHAEAKVHNVPVEQIHFHEVGAIDAIVDIVAASAGIHALDVDQWHTSPLNVGGGTVECAHGRFPVPAPAVSELLRGFPTYSAHVQQELVTPTGAALVRALDPTFGQQPPMRVSQIGYGAGSRNPNNFPNTLRLQVGDALEDEASTSADTVVTVLETALDDLSPQVIAYVAEKALAEGALDVMLTPVIMKKGRLGTLVTILCTPSQRASMESLLLRETSTLGVRIRQERRICLERSHTTVSTDYGPIRVKTGRWNDEELNMAPEFEDCRSAAAQHHVALKQVQQAAIAAYLRLTKS